MKQFFLIAISVVCLLSCRKRYEAPVPNLDWDLFTSAATSSLQSAAIKKIDGIYTISNANDLFGADAAAKWSYTVNGTDTTYHISFFCQKDITYIICEGRRLDSSILLNGYWRRMVGTETGKARLTITKDGGAAKLLSGSAISSTDKISINGTYGNGDAVPDKPVSLTYTRPVYKATPLEIVAHRGGGRSADLLPASENSVELIKMAARFGATGIEIDVHMTADGELVLFHDAVLSERLIQKNGLVGPIENYTYAQLTALVRLINGERIPTLREALTAMVYSTPIKYAWLDTKLTGSLQKLRDIQAEFIQKAAAIGRTVTITIGIPETQVEGNFQQLPNYTTIPSVNELSLDDVQKVNSAIWGPRFTLGLQNDEVAAAHAQGRKVYVWTLDIPENIQEYLYNGHFDGILSNYPSAVAYYYYARP